MRSRIVLAVYSLGRLALGIQSRTLRLALWVPYWLLYSLVKGCLGAEISARTEIGKRLRLPHGANGVVVHADTVIGDDCVIYHQVTLGGLGHQVLSDSSTYIRLGAPVVGDRVMIGAGAKVLGRVRIGDDARIGANAVVVSDVPPGATAVGIPATVRAREGT